MTLVLSQLFLNLEQQEVRRDLGNPYDMHRTLARVYASGPDSAMRPFLWRQEPSRTDDPPQVLVQSESEPNWSALPPNYLLQHAQRTWKPEAVLREGQRLRFRLRANPTINRVPQVPDGQQAPVGSARGQRKRLGLWKEQEQIAWLQRQAERLGLSCLDAAVISSERLRCRRRGSVITVAAAHYEGQAMISKPDALAAGIRGGVGHARMLGLGLVSVAPMRF